MEDPPLILLNLENMADYFAVFAVENSAGFSYNEVTKKKAMEGKKCLKS